MLDNERQLLVSLIKKERKNIERCIRDKKLPPTSHGCCTAFHDYCADKLGGNFVSGTVYNVRYVGTICSGCISVLPDKTQGLILALI